MSGNWKSKKFLTQSEYTALGTNCGLTYVYDGDRDEQAYDIDGEKYILLVPLDFIFQDCKVAFIYHDPKRGLGDIRSDCNEDSVSRNIINNIVYSEDPFSSGRIFKEMSGGEAKITGIHFLENKETKRVVFVYDNNHEIHFCSNPLEDEDKIEYVGAKKPNRATLGEWKWKSNTLKKSEYSNSPEAFSVHFINKTEEYDEVVDFLSEFFTDHDTAYIYHNPDSSYHYSFEEVYDESFEDAVGIGKAISSLDKSEISEVHYMWTGKEKARVVFVFSNGHEVHFCSEQLK